MKFFKSRSVHGVVFLVVLVTVWGLRRGGGEPATWEQPTMGTLCHITLSDPIKKQELVQVRKAIDLALEQVNAQLSTWEPKSEISTFNAFHSLDAFPISPEFSTVVRRALEYSASTKGAFDPTVKPLVDHWGFGPEAETENLEEIMKTVGWQKVRLEQGLLSKMNPKVQLDLSAIAKGYGVDGVADVIRSFDLINFLVEIGGEIVADGTNLRGQYWRVGIEVPTPNQAFGSEIFQTLELSGQAMATSGDYRNFRTREDGTRYSHIIDPHTGNPAETDVAAVSVLANSCMDADAVATALFVMGSDESFQWLETHPEFDAFFILHAPDGTFATRATDGFPIPE